MSSACNLASAAPQSTANGKYTAKMKNSEWLMKKNERPNQIPRVTFALFTYNQEAFVADAVNSALGQDYSNLEVIISDDCSTDQTFRKLSEIVSNYTGPHTVHLSRNATNLGVCEHVNKVHELSTGEIIVHAAGDDVSYPLRVARIVEHFSQAGEACVGVFSNAHVIDSNGNSTRVFFRRVPKFARDLEDFRRQANCWAFGASLSFRTHAVKSFGKLDSRALQEDGVIAFRLILRGTLDYIPDCLLGYRIHGQNSSDIGNVEKYCRIRRQRQTLVTIWRDEAKMSGARDDILSKLTLMEIRARIEGFFFSLRPFALAYILCVRILVLLAGMARRLS